MSADFILFIITYGILSITATFHFYHYLVAWREGYYK